jgi:aspartate-semialdehyde dehydrogenase
MSARAAGSAARHPAAPATRIPVAVLGATGAVGQNFIRLLADHPWFELAELAASERSAGKAYEDAARWIGGSGIPASARRQVVRACDPSEVSAPIVFSALDAAVAGDVELAFAKAGRMVLSNAKNYRMDDDVPLVIPEVNAGHLALLDVQRARRGWSGGIVTNANCAAIVAVMGLAPLHEAFGIRRLFMATMQAVSGAGYPGVPSLDILGNVIPFISGEEPKIETEIQKMLGRLGDARVDHAPITISAHANRVAVENGHTVNLSVDFEGDVTPEEALEALRAWRGDESALGLPTSPERALVVTDLPDRPQPRRDVDAGRGMTVTVGRVRKDPLFGVKLVAMGHNTVRGAAGASVLNAELLVATGRVGST